MIRRPPRSTQSRSSAASDVYKRQGWYANDSVGFLLVASKYLDDKINRQAETIRDLEDRIAIMEQAIADAGLFN